MATTNADQFSRALSTIGKQIPFALAGALNNVAADIQRAQVAHMHQIFTVRVPSFIGTPEAAHRSAIKRTLKATKTAPVVELAVLPPGGLARADIISRHESDRERKPKGGGSLAIPITARRGKRDKVPAKLRPKALGLKPAGASGTVFHGEQRTFLVRGPSGGGTIYQRTSRKRGGKRRKRGPGSSDPFAGTKVLFRLESSTPLTPELHFVDNATKVFHAKLEGRFAEAFKKALETAK